MEFPAIAKVTKKMYHFNTDGLLEVEEVEGIAAIYNIIASRDGVIKNCYLVNNVMLYNSKKTYNERASEFYIMDLLIKKELSFDEIPKEYIGRARSKNKIMKIINKKNGRT